MANSKILHIDLHHFAGRLVPNTHVFETSTSRENSGSTARRPEVASEAHRRHEKHAKIICLAISITANPTSITLPASATHTFLSCSKSSNWLNAAQLFPIDLRISATLSEPTHHPGSWLTQSIVYYSMNGRRNHRHTHDTQRLQLSLVAVPVYLAPSLRVFFTPVAARLKHTYIYKLTAPGSSSQKSLSSSLSSESGSAAISMRLFFNKLSFTPIPNGFGLCLHATRGKNTMEEAQPYEHETRQHTQVQVHAKRYTTNNSLSHLFLQHVLGGGYSMRRELALHEQVLTSRPPFIHVIHNKPRMPTCDWT